MDENKRKQIEAKLFQLFSQTDVSKKNNSSSKTTPVVKVIRRRKGKPDLQVA